MNETSKIPVISVVIVSWNARRYLLQCLDSLSPAACRYPMEIVVVDNASSDGSPDSVAALHPEVRLIRNTSNLGFAKANNIGIAASTGSYLCLVNSDVKVLPDCMNRLVDFCERNPNVGMCGPGLTGGDGRLQRSCRGFPSAWNMFCRALALDLILPGIPLFSGYLLSHWPQDCLREVDILTGCFWLVRREAMNQVGWLDESFFMYGEDMDWCRRFRNRGWRVIFVPQAGAIHYGGASSSNAPVYFYIEKQKADLQYWRKHHSPYSAAFYVLISCLHMSVRAVGYSMVILFKNSGRRDYGHKVNRSLACLRWLITGSRRPEAMQAKGA